MCTKYKRTIHESQRNSLLELTQVKEVNTAVYVLCTPFLIIVLFPPLKNAPLTSNTIV